jgi:hypothetical protein
MAQQPLVGQGVLFVKTTRPLSDTPHSVGLLWTSDQPVTETSTWQHKTLTGQTDIYAPAGFFLVLFVPLTHFVPLNPSVLLRVTYVPYYCPYTTNTTQTSMPPVGSEPTIPAKERPQTYALDRTATGIRTRNLSMRAAPDPHLRQRGHWDRTHIQTQEFGNTFTEWWRDREDRHQCYTLQKGGNVKRGKWLQPFWTNLPHSAYRSFITKFW